MYWISQQDILETAKLLCRKNIDQARISYHCNADQTNGANTYNYLRAHGALRRLTKRNEFDGKKEVPHELPYDEKIFGNRGAKLSDLLEWYNNIYCELDLESYESEATIELTSDTNHRTNIPIVPESVKLSINETYGVNDINTRAISAIKSAWDVFSKKVGGGIIQINKEASMQLHFAYVLQQVMPLIIFQDDERIDIELETSISDGQTLRNADIMMNVYKGNEFYRIVLELKCYKKLASSGGNRGATDIFMKDIYMDLHLLERYCENYGADYGICLVMTDHKYFVHAEKKEGKCWDYDTTHGTEIGNKVYTTPIGGKSVEIDLKDRYCFNWSSEGDYYFVLLEKL